MFFKMRNIILNKLPQDYHQHNDVFYLLRPHLKTSLLWHDIDLYIYMDFLVFLDFMNLEGILGILGILLSGNIISAGLHAD